MQFDRSADGTLTPLPKPSVDTGAGLERIAAVMQGEDDNFHTDLFLPLWSGSASWSARPYDRSGEDARIVPRPGRSRPRRELSARRRRLPGNEGRGYVLRRILRRAVRHAWLLGRREPTLATLTSVVVEQLGGVYPELVAKAGYIHEVTETEERRFLETIDGGLGRLEEIFASGARTIPGDEAFKLYDTFGFPIDLTEIIAGERGVTVDLEGFDRELEKQRKRSRDARGSRRAWPRLGAAVRPPSQARQVAHRQARQAEVRRVSAHGDRHRRARIPAGRPARRADPPGKSVLRRVGRPGQRCRSRQRPRWSLPVDAVRKDPRGTVVGGAFEAPFDPATLHAAVNAPRRHDIERNHSATHLVHYALRKHLGPHVRQQGSLVEPERLRFDFSHHGPIDADTLHRIESEVNDLVLENPAW